VRALVATLLVALLVSPAARAQVRERDGGWLIERDTVEIEPKGGVKVKKVSVDNRLGDVKVVGHDGPGVSLSVVKRAPDGTVLDRMKVNLVTDPDGTITIGTALLAGAEATPVPAKSIRIDISLEVPRGASISVQAWNGKVSVAGVRSGATLSAHVGEITVTDVSGTVVTESAQGSQTLTGVRGSVDADLTYGNLALDGISGDTLAASTHDGPIVATRVKSKKVRITTTFGTIHFSGEVLATGDVEIVSYKGDVNVSLVPSKGLGFQLDAYARDGVIDSKLELTEREQPEKGRLVGSYGTVRKKPAVLKVRSVVGDVRIGLVAD
jgi:hypothetical protein